MLTVPDISEPYFMRSNLTSREIIYMHCQNSCVIFGLLLFVCFVENIQCGMYIILFCIWFLYLRFYVCMYVYLYVYVYICMCICI